jgi:hypothetical protein
MEYTWTIAQLERNTADDFVTIVHYRVTAVDGDLHSIHLRHCRLHTRKRDIHSLR